jgi:predicted metal-binding protein
MREAVIHVCVTCRRDGDDPAARRRGAQLHDQLAAAAAHRVVPVECLGNCRRACSVSISAAGAWTYVFGDLDEGSGPDVLAAADLLAASSDGLMPWRGRPDPFKRGMVARIPPLDSAKEAAE